MLNPGLVFAVAVVAFVVITWRLRWPLPLGLIATSMLAAALAGYSTPFRHLVEGGFGYINLTLGLFAGAFFGQTMRLSGAADAVAVKMDQVLRGNDWLILGFSGAILFLVGMFVGRSEEHTSELQSLMRISYAVFCLKKKKITDTKNATHI